MHLTHQSDSKSITTKDRRDKATNEGVSLPSRTIVHAKLEMTSPQDAEELEADAVANEIVSGGKIKRKISQGSTDSSGIAVSSQMEGQLSHLQGGGRQMPAGLQNMMERGFNRDFSQVRLHTDSEAASLSSSIHAKAFTHGNDIYFNQGQFSPNTSEGQTLMAHELTHVVQGVNMIARTTSYKKINNTNYDELHDKIIEICDKVLPIVDKIVDGSISQDDLNKCKGLYSKYVNPNPPILNRNPFLDFNINIQTLLTQLKLKLGRIKLGIKEGLMSDDPEAECSTTGGKKKIHKITCYSDVWEQYHNEQHAFAIIHEFSHMWLDTTDDCYWFSGSSHRANLTDLMSQTNYCGNYSNQNRDKSKIASAMEYYIRGIYKIT